MYKFLSGWLTFFFFFFFWCLSLSCKKIFFLFVYLFICLLISSRCSQAKQSSANSAELKGSPNNQKEQLSQNLGTKTKTDNGKQNNRQLVHYDSLDSNLKGRQSDTRCNIFIVRISEKRPVLCMLPFLLKITAFNDIVMWIHSHCNHWFILCQNLWRYILTCKLSDDEQNDHCIYRGIG